MRKFKITLPFMQQEFAYNGKTLYMVTTDQKGAPKLTTFKGGTIKECLDYVKTVYKIDDKYIKETK